MTATTPLTTTPLTVAVLGAGTIGRTLATGWARAGHRVVLGTRQPHDDRIHRAIDETGADHAAPHADAARAAQAVLIAVPGDQVDPLVATLGHTLRGRITIDATNALTPGATNLHHIDALVRAGAVAYRAFNTTGWEQMQRPMFGEQRADMPFSGPDNGGRDVVTRLIDEIGFRPIWLGDGADAHALTDALARLWFQLAFRQGWGRRLGWRMLTDADD